MIAEEGLGRLAGLPVVPERSRKFLGATEPLPSPETAAEAAVRIAEADRRRRERYERQAGRYAGARTGDLDGSQDPQGRIRGWWTTESRTLLIASEAAGVGKTHAAHAVLGQAFVAGAHVEAWTVIDLLAVMREEMREQGSDVTAGRVRAADLLLLDDLGKEQATPWALEQVHRVIDVRMRERRRVVATTNLSADEVAQRYGAPLLDRLLDSATVIRMTGVSRRREAAW